MSEIHPEQDQLFPEFSPQTIEAWRAAAVAALKGASFEKKLITRTYEGIDLQPIYHPEDVAGIAHQYSAPGAPPFVRGSQPAGYRGQAWAIAQEINAPTPEAFNEMLRAEIERGQTAINIVPDRPTRACQDPDQVESELVGRHGISLASADDWTQALKDIELAKLPLLVRAGAAALPLTVLLVASLRKQGRDPKILKGSIAFDPLAVLAHQGSLPVSLAQAYDELAQLTGWAAANAPDLDTVSVYGDAYHESGASAVQELAYMLGAGTEYLRTLLDRGLSIDTAAGRMRFFFVVGSNFFGEVAKLRAARILWAQVVQAFGGSVAVQAMKQHARTALFNKSTLDPYVNMLRTTIEAFAGAAGGVDSLQVAPFDAVMGSSDNFGRRVARNQQLVLQQEAHLTRVIDPAGGSWYVETLTDDLARRAWALFQEIEAGGGLAAALQAGTVQKAIADVATERANNLAKRRDVMVGVNQFANPKEKPLQSPEVLDEVIYKERSGLIASQRNHPTSQSVLEKLNNASGERVVDVAIEAAEAGATLSEIAQVLRAGDSEAISITPLCLHRIAEPFEALRARSVAYLAEHGHAPRIFLATMGPLAQHKARADFSQGFFEVGGFELIYPAGFDSAEEAARAAAETGAQAVVICSTDETYPELVPALAEALKATLPEAALVLAGYPEDQVKDHMAAGVEFFVHLRADCAALNADLLARVGA